MKATTMFGWAAAVLLAASMAPSGSASAYGSHYFDFEESTKGWVSNTDANSRVAYMQLKSGENGCSDMRGNSFAILSSVHVGPVADDDSTYSNSTADGSAVPLPVGTWAVADFEAHEGKNGITVEFNARNVDGCDGCSLMAYVGSSPPTSITQFNEVQSSSAPLTDWRSFRYDDVVQLGEKDRLHVALGLNKVDISIGLDCVNVSFLPFDN